jgi:hypothetical protein
VFSADAENAQCAFLDSAGGKMAGFDWRWADQSVACWAVWARSRFQCRNGRRSVGRAGYDWLVLGFVPQQRFVVSGFWFVVSSAANRERQPLLVQA